MNTKSIIKLNFQEIRRHSEMIWNAIPQEFYLWKPDDDALSMLQMIRHVLEGEAWFHHLVINKGAGQFNSPWHNLPYTNITDEINFAIPYRKSFFETLNSFSETDFEEIEIVRKDINQKRKLGDYLNRMAYHESVHTGQLLSYLRTAGISIPKIWD